MIEGDESFGSEEASTTARMRPKGAFVLVVHDPGDDGHDSWDALIDHYIVQDVTDGFEALEWLGNETALACVVCVVGKTIRGADFFRLVSRISAEQARRVVFIVRPDDPDIAFLRSEQCHWLATPVKRVELVALVRAVGAR